MCANYQLKSSAEKLMEKLGPGILTFTPDGDIIGGNYFPKSTVPIVHADAGERTLAEAQWGIDLGRFHVTNSRDDKVGRTWKRYMGRRVVFPMNRAIEWKYPLVDGKAKGKPKQWALYPADESLAVVAGIASKDYAGVSMMTCRANGIAAEVHNKKPDDPRMVVFLTESNDVDAWLDPDRDYEDVADLLKPPPAGWLAGEPLAGP